MIRLLCSCNDVVLGTELPSLHTDLVSLPQFLGSLPFPTAFGHLGAEGRFPATYFEGAFGAEGGDEAADLGGLPRLSGGIQCTGLDTHPQRCLAVERADDLVYPGHLSVFSRQFTGHIWQTDRVIYVFSK